MRFAYLVALGCSLVTALPAAAAGINWSPVDNALGKPGTDQPGEVHKYSLPRTDLHVTLDGVPILPQFALGGWLAFEPMGQVAMLMGDLVLTQKEVAPVMSKLLAAGITVTALHNHLLRAEPLPFYMHISGRGDPVRLAHAVREALGASATPFGNAQTAPAAAPALDTAALDRALGRKGKASGGLYHFAIPRAEPIAEDGVRIPPAMGTATSLGFEPLGGGRAAIYGDLVLAPKEVPGVLRVLSERGIEVMALHNHMLNEQPRLVFMHFWGVGNAVTLADGMHAALDLVHLAPAG